jgi:hypothetical protein
MKDLLTALANNPAFTDELVGLNKLSNTRLKLVVKKGDKFIFTNASMVNGAWDFFWSTYDIRTLEQAKKLLND